MLYPHRFATSADVDDLYVLWSENPDSGVHFFRSINDSEEIPWTLTTQLKSIARFEAKKLKGEWEVIDYHPEEPQVYHFPYGNHSKSQEVFLVLKALKAELPEENGIIEFV